MESNKYIRMHVVEAKPMTRGDYNKKRGWELPANENPNDEGYIVSCPDGYVSWCPKKQFEDAARPCDGMTFGMAVEAMQRGKKVCRKGWNGKGMYVWLMPGSTVIGCPNIVDPHLAEIDKAEGKIDFLGSIRMRTADGCVLTGWLASQTDILSEDWMVVE